MVVCGFQEMCLLIQLECGATTQYRPLVLGVVFSPGQDDHAGQVGKGEERRKEQCGGVRLRHEGQTARSPGEVCQRCCE